MEEEKMKEVKRKENGKGMIKVMLHLCFVMLLVGMVIIPITAKADAVGTAIISTNNLINISSNTKTDYYLACDKDLKGKLWVPIRSFSGRIDGNGFQIKNLNSSRGGLFHELRENAVVKNLRINVKIKSSNDKIVGIANYVSGSNMK